MATAKRARSRSIEGNETLADVDALQGSRDRQRAMAQFVVAHGTVLITELATRFGVTSMTVRRDLDELGSIGILRRTHGRATAISSSLFEASSEYRIDENRLEKLAVAKAASSYVKPGQAVFLDDSTTSIFVAQEIKALAPLTVITNFDAIAQLVKKESGITLNLIGGQYQPWCDAYQGGQTLDSIKRMRADVFIMSTAAIVDNVCFHQALETGLIKSAMFESSSTRILCVDHTKFQRRALHMMAPLTDFDMVIVDSGTPSSVLQELKQHGVNVEVAQDDISTP